MCLFLRIQIKKKLRVINIHTEAVSFAEAEKCDGFIFQMKLEEWKRCVTAYKVILGHK